ncbi:FAD/NAD(P)-binding protein [Phyllobacterium myrsinacearum]|uniref:Putative NAD(P)/FAD-binding protein YdhS n=1 Tax=Phyllobacterium myrsinacearum TaxID=28101 RepID=A0A839EUE7_9HYPH|nr:FAD/NAD(P)-binding protein [Phyllobacterium myrsinacearum]MBA8880037.1 putative NAD(P)/FAD-binding protein YdhS [Phyllobacterium myrsinacearum]
MDASFAPPRSIVIIGGGFAGSVAALKLFDHTTVPLAISIIERRSELGRGVAYSTTEPVHLVNGPARIFSLYPDDPEHLVRWLQDHGAENGWIPPDDVADSSPPRWLFGTYVQAELQHAISRAGQYSTLRHIQASATEIRTELNSVQVSISTGTTVFADEAILALGAFQGEPSDVEAAVTDHPAFVGNPWNPQALDRLVNAKNLLLVGSSLSMVDVVASMEMRGYRGHYHVLSRRGQVVDGRRDAEPWHDFLSEKPLPVTARTLLSLVKSERRAVAAAGQDWQALPVAIRPHILALWQGASDSERLRFNRHLRPFWDVTAHRSAPPSHHSVANAKKEGRLTSAAGRIQAFEPEDTGIAAVIRRRSTGKTERITFDGVVNCRGHQQHDWRKIPDPFIRYLLASGEVRPHGTGFGIDATSNGAVINANGQVHGNLHAIGHPLRGVAWESSSITEQLAQAIALAERLLSKVSMKRAAAS